MARACGEFALTRFRWHVDGKANKALCGLIAKRLRVAPSRVSVVRGEKSREKVVRVEGIDEVTLSEALG